MSASQSSATSSRGRTGDRGQCGTNGRRHHGVPGLFRLGIASLVVVIALDVVVAWALYRVFSPCQQEPFMLAMALRLVYSGVFMVAIGHLLGAVRLLSNDGYLAVFGADQVNAQAMLEITAFNDIWYVGQFLFGLHLLLIGYLAYRSGYVPRLLGALIAISGLGYVPTASAVLSQGTWTDISSFTFLGEFLLALWLVIGPAASRRPPQRFMRSRSP